MISKDTVILDNENVIVYQDWGRVANILKYGLGIADIEKSNVKKRLKHNISGGDNPLSSYIISKISYNDYWSSYLEFENKKVTDNNIRIASYSLEELTSDVNEDVLNVLSDLKANNYNLFMLTNGSPEIEKGNRKRNNYFALFDGIQYPHHVGWRKPQPEAYLNLLERYNLDKNRCVFVDDKKENVLAAQKLGIDSIQYDINEPVDNLVLRLEEKGIK